MPSSVSERTANDIDLQEKPWESGLLGLPVYQLRFRPDGAASGLASIQDSLRRIDESFSDTRALLCARLPATDGARVRALEEAGFHLMECYLTLRHALDSLPSSLEEAGISPATPAELPALRRIAAESFQYSRFHMDPHIGREKAALTPSEWVENAVKGGDKTVLIVRAPKASPKAIVEEEIAGFVCIRIPSGSGVKKTGVLDLIAVHPDYQGQGLGLALTRACLETCRREGCDSVEVGTQAHNIPSIRLYETAGFRLSGAAYSYHKHTGTAAP
jgi:ribosomal protein S18 acetylase RimI-like enzyme